MCSGASRKLRPAGTCHPTIWCVYLGRGESDQAMDCLERARDERADRRSQALLRKMNLA